MEPSRHRHEPGEDRSRCRTCQEAGLKADFTEFEKFCYEWQKSNVNQVVLEGGLLPMLISRLTFKPPAETIFLTAMNEIQMTERLISQQQLAKRG